MDQRIPTSDGRCHFDVEIGGKPNGCRIVRVSVECAGGPDGQGAVEWCPGDGTALYVSIAGQNIEVHLSIGTGGQTTEIRLRSGPSETGLISVGW